MRSIRWLGRQWAVILTAGLFGLIFIFANSTPLEGLFVWQDRADKLLILTLGGVYWGLKRLPDGIALVTVMLIVFVLIVAVKVLIRDRRVTTLVSLVLLCGANCVLFSAPGLVLSRSVGEKVVDCEMFITPQIGLRIVRYPVDVGMDYAEQQFFLMTHDGGQTWGQFLQTFTYHPSLERCQYVESFEGENGVLRIEHSDKPGEYELIRYITEDGGRTWRESK